MGAEPHPSDGASIRAHKRAVRPAMDSSAPIGSSLGLDGSRESLTKKKPPMRPRITTGTLTRNTEPHQNRWSSHPPAIGPMAIPMPDTPAQMPIALPRSPGSRNVLVRIDRVDGMMIAPPTPISDRVAM